MTLGNPKVSILNVEASQCFCNSNTSLIKGLKCCTLTLVFPSVITQF